MWQVARTGNSHVQNFSKLAAELGYSSC